jgi:uncharacterized protein (UPF0305 family)
MSKELIDFLNLVANWVLPILTIFISIIWRINEKNKLKSNLNIKLIDKYHSIEFYKGVRSTVWSTYVKWSFLPPKKQENYQKDVMRGWIDYDNNNIYTNDEILKHEISLNNIDINHHLDEVKKDYLTEHQALTIYFSFWTTVYTFLKTKPSRQIIEYWQQLYNYDKSFIGKLREMVKAAWHEKENNIPTWVSVTSGLEEIFENINSQNTKHPKKAH